MFFSLASVAVLNDTEAGSRPAGFREVRCRGGRNSGPSSIGRRTDDQRGIDRGGYQRQHDTGQVPDRNRSACATRQRSAGCLPACGRSHPGTAAKRCARGN